MIAIWAAVGVVVGGLVAWTVASRHAQALRDQVNAATTRAEVAESLQRAATETLERERGEHARAVENLEALFESTSHKVMASSLASFNDTQERILRERDSKLKDSLGPLEELLGQYRVSLEAFDREHRDALFDVRRRAGDLLEAQQRTQLETSRLNQLLGRSADRGRWGEIQLENVLRASNLRPTVDYVLQSTHAGDAGQRQRPDCIVNLSNDAKIVIDAKFPFANFEKAISSEDPAERRLFEQRSAADLREHVKALSAKSYFEALEFSPEFTVCFVPSDAALAAAYEADATLHDFATEKRILLAGPTNLLALLWSAAEVLRRAGFAANAQEILKTAGELYNRVRVVAGPLAKLGKSLNDSVTSYNEAIASVEARLIPIARKIHSMEGVAGAKPIEDLAEITATTRALDAPKWGADLDDPVLSAQSRIIEIDDVEEDELPAE